MGVTKEQRELMLKTRFCGYFPATVNNSCDKNASRMICIEGFGKNSFLSICIGSKAELTFSFSVRILFLLLS